MRRFITLILLCFTATACSSDAQTVDVQQVYTSLKRFNQLVGLYSPNDGSSRLYALEQSGIISSFDASNPTDTTRFLNIRTKITSGGEMGLLGLAFDPDFRNNGIFYLNFTRTSRVGNEDQLQTIIARYRTMQGNPLVADTGSEETILTIDQPYQNHNGGHIVFGPDGFLYIGMGDGGSGGDPQGHGQNRASLLGKILRINVRNISGSERYTIPADNPYVGNGQGYREEIYAYGVRNPWRFSFDAPTGTLWAGDVGQDRWEEIHIIEKGKNYGWKIMEGFHCYPSGSNCDTTGLEMPIWEYPHDSTGGTSVTGGYVYHGTAAPSMQGKYIYADFTTGKIWAITYNPTTRQASNQLVRKIGSPISAFGLDPQGELLICGYDGRIYKLEQTSGVERDERASKAAAIRFISPNPATSETAVTFALGAAGHVRLTLHDAVGREVATLVDGNRSEGEHRVMVDIAALPAATYFCRLVHQGITTVERMVVVR